MTKTELYNLNGYFIKEYCTPNIFIMTEEGNFLFSDPQYRGGTNKLIKTELTAKKWMENKQTYNLGNRTISEYCGDFIFEE
jgi:hypothetical protein